MKTTIDIEWVSAADLSPLDTTIKDHNVSYLVLTTGNQRWMFVDVENVIRFILEQHGAVWYAIVPWPALPSEGYNENSGS